MNRLFSFKHERPSNRTTVSQFTTLREQVFLRLDSFLNGSNGRFKLAEISFSEVFTSVSAMLTFTTNDTPPSMTLDYVISL